MDKRILPTPEQLRELLRYEPDTGKLFWKARPASMFPPGNRTPDSNCRAFNSRWAGKEALTNLCKGYLRGEIFHRSMNAHHVAWAVFYGEWPVGMIDHKNLVRTDNRIANLRLATSSQNCANSPGRPGSVSGLKGAHWWSTRGVWRSRITVRGVEISLGNYDSAEDAHSAYCKAAKKHFGEFARTT